jgi:hypothetical protein
MTWIWVICGYPQVEPWEYPRVWVLDPCGYPYGESFADLSMAFGQSSE